MFMTGHPSASRQRRGITAALMALTLVATTIVVTTIVAAVPPATADTAPIDPSEAPSVSSDALPTVQINGVVWSQAVIGGTVFAGGNFTNARPAGSAAGENTVGRTHLLSYSISTGVLNAAFKPTLNGQVRSVAASPDRTRLYIGGDFTRVNGADRNRVAAFDAVTGALLPWSADVNANVRAIAATDTTVYFGGSFTAVNGSTRSRAAAVSSDGSLQSWAPVAGTYNVNAITVSPDGSRVALGGAFTTLNGSSNPGYGLGLVSGTGSGTQNLPLQANTVIRDAGPNGAIVGLSSDSDSFYAVGYDFGTGANFEGTVRVNWSDGRIAWVEDCHGDSYSAYSTGTLVYKASHAHDCSTVPNGLPTLKVWYHSVAFTKQVKGVLKKTTQVNYPSFEGQPAPSQVNWYPTYTNGIFTGQGQSTWHVTGGGSYVVYAGEFLRVNNTPQQGLVRFAVKEVAPNKDGPRLTGTGFAPSASSPSAGVITISWPANWDRDNERLTYRVIRNGASTAPVGIVTGDSRFFRRPTLSFTDSGLTPGGTYSYAVRAIDPFGNIQTSSSVTATAKTGTVANQPPVAAFTSSTSGLTASLNGSGSSDPDGSISSWAWNFGDGTTGAGVTASRTYAAAGSFSVTLTVTDNRGLTHSRTQTVSVSTPPVATNVASDDFTRVVSGGWGTAPTGGPWSVAGTASDYSVASDVGHMQVPSAGSTRTARLNGVSSTSTDVRVRLSLQQAVTGGPAYVWATARAVGGSEYRARLVVGTTGAVTLQLQQGATSLQAMTVPGITYTAAMPLELRVQVYGTAPTTIRAKVWSPDTAEPATWMLTATDDTAAMQTGGSVGVGAYMGGTSTNLPRLVQFDNFSAMPVE